MSSLFVITELLNQRSLHVRSFSFRPVYLFHIFGIILLVQGCFLFFFCQWKLKVSIRHLLTLVPLMHAVTSCFLCTVDYALMLLSSPSLHFSAVISGASNVWSRVVVVTGSAQCLLSVVFTVLSFPHSAVC